MSDFPDFGLRLTRWGALFLVALLLLGLAAVNTGNNALIMLLGMMIASFILGGLWSREVLRGLAVEVEVPREVFAGRPTPVEVTLENRSRLWPAYGVLLRDRRGRTLVLEPHLRAGGRRRHTVSISFPRRGWRDLGPWRLEVLLPLGFFVKSKATVREQRLLVYPRLLARSARLAPRGGRRWLGSAARHGREGEVLSLRPYRDGDELRHVHWKQTARQQRLIVAERQAPEPEALFVVLDPRVSDPASAEVRERFEQLVSEAASAVVERLRAGELVGAVVGRVVVAPVRGVGHAPSLLRPLAEVEAVAAAEVPPPAPRSAMLAFRLEGAA